MRDRPLLLVWYAAALMLAGRSDGVEALLEEADRALAEVPDEPRADEDDHSRLLATAAAVRSMHARFRGDAQGAIEHARRALALLPEDNLDPRPFAAIALAQAYQAAGDLEAAIAAFAEAGALGQAAGHDYIALSAMASRAHLQLARGRLREADQVLRSALGFAAEREAELLPALGSVRIATGELCYEWNELDAAARHLTEGVELAGRTGDVGILMWGHIVLSEVRLAQGDAEGPRGGQGSGAGGPELGRRRSDSRRGGLEGTAPPGKRGSGIRLLRAGACGARGRSPAPIPSWSASCWHGCWSPETSPRSAAAAGAAAREGRDPGHDCTDAGAASAGPAGKRRERASRGAPG